jgi:mercuric ion transport protein
MLVFHLRSRNREAEMTNNALLATGLIGTIVVALCCFTPILVVLLGIVGLSALVGWLDIVLFPALAFFIGLTIYALWRRQKHARAS